MPNYTPPLFLVLLCAKSFCKSTNKQMADRVIDWSDLPKELLLCIGKKLKSGVEVLQFRSVCASWRSSIPSFREISPLPLPFPGPAGEAFVSLSTYYRLVLAHQNSNPSKGLLVRIEESEPGKVRLLNALTGRHISYLPKYFHKAINLLDFQVFEVSKAYKVRYLSGNYYTAVKKMVLFPNPVWTRAEDCAVFFIYLDGRLGYAKYGDESSTLVDKQNFHYDDIIVYKGQFYVIDRLGKVSWIDSSLKLIRFSPQLRDLGSQKHLVESCGELYVLDRYFDEVQSQRRYGDENMLVSIWYRSRGPHRNSGFNVCRRTIDFKVYKLDQEWGTWVEVKNLGDTIFILGNDCSFSVSAREYPGCEGNCIYFTDENDFVVFNIGVGTFSGIQNFPELSHIFLPPPSWLRPNLSSSTC